MCESRRVETETDEIVEPIPVPDVVQMRAELTDKLADWDVGIVNKDAEPY